MALNRSLHAPRNAEDHINSMTTRIEKLERKKQVPTLVFIQPDEPLNVDVGTLWYDTDEPVV